MCRFDSCYPCFMLPWSFFIKNNKNIFPTISTSILQNGITIRSIKTRHRQEKPDLIKKKKKTKVNRKKLFLSNIVFFNTKWTVFDRGRLSSKKLSSMSSEKTKKRGTKPNRANFRLRSKYLGIPFSNIENKELVKQQPNSSSPVGWSKKSPYTILQKPITPPTPTDYAIGWRASGRLWLRVIDFQLKYFKPKGLLLSRTNWNRQLKVWRRNLKKTNFYYPKINMHQYQAYQNIHKSKNSVFSWILRQRRANNYFNTRVLKLLGKFTYHITKNGYASGANKNTKGLNFTLCSSTFERPFFLNENEGNKRPLLKTSYIISVLSITFTSILWELSDILPHYYQEQEHNLKSLKFQWTQTFFTKLIFNTTDPIRKLYFPSCKNSFLLAPTQWYNNKISTQKHNKTINMLQPKIGSNRNHLLMCLSFSALVKWSLKQFYVLKKKRKTYLGLYVAPSTYFTANATYYTTLNDQVTFKSAICFTLPSYQSRFMYNLSNGHFFSSRFVDKSVLIPRVASTYFVRSLYRFKNYVGSLSTVLSLLKLISGNNAFRFLMLKYLVYMQNKSAAIDKTTSFSYVKYFWVKRLKNWFSKQEKHKGMLRIYSYVLKKRRRKSRTRVRPKPIRKFILQKASWWIFIFNNLTNVYVPTYLRDNFLTVSRTAIQFKPAAGDWTCLTNSARHSKVFQTSLTDSLLRKSIKPLFNIFPFLTSMVNWQQGAKSNFQNILSLPSFYLKFNYYRLQFVIPRCLLVTFFKYSMQTFPTSINLIPTDAFNTKLPRFMNSIRANLFFQENITPWTYTTLLRFIEFTSGKKVLVDVYSFMDQTVDLYYSAFYRTWMPRFAYYERRLGHRFFLEEALHILHMSFTYKDSKMLSSWLKAIIQRISFWKTRFIFRFLKYILNNYFQDMLSDLGVKGLKIKLKGKISVAGNSRKRTILYRLGKTSHASAAIKVVHTMDTIVTFTGVMGFQIWIFY